MFKGSLRPMKNPLINKVSIILFLILLFILEVYILKINPLVIIFIISLFLYLEFKKKISEGIPYKITHLILLYLLFVFISDTVIRNNRPIYFIPFSLIPILVTVIFSDLEISLIMSFALGIRLSFQINNFYWGIILFTTGIFSSLISWKPRRRFKIIQAGIFSGLIQCIELFFMHNFMIKEDFLIYPWLFLNGFVSGIVVSGVLPIFEYLFERITNISLLELSDFNSPLLKEMILKAPGTYHHSLIVGNLSEAASEAIGADSLLSRIGAYYHDIGKIIRPQYFIENQLSNQAFHEKLSPALSKLIIVNHVKEGIRLAKRYKLNKKIIDFIAQHHGTSLVYYFYLKALEDNKEDVDDKLFRYPGPKPKTKETAIVLLADSVEAASRVLRDPNPNKIAELVRRVVNSKFIDGQLDECPLTLRDLEKITEVFIRILTSMYHVRVAYPQGVSS